MRWFLSYHECWAFCHLTRSLYFNLRDIEIKLGYPSDWKSGKYYPVRLRLQNLQKIEGWIIEARTDSEFTFSESRKILTFMRNPFFNHLLFTLDFRAYQSDYETPLLLNHPSFIPPPLSDQVCRIQRWIEETSRSFGSRTQGCSR